MTREESYAKAKALCDECASDVSGLHVRIAQEFYKYERDMSKLYVVALAANAALRVLKSAYGNQYPGEMYELVALDKALGLLSEKV